MSDRATLIKNLVSLKQWIANRETPLGIQVSSHLSACGLWHWRIHLDQFLVFFIIDHRQPRCIRVWGLKIVGEDGIDVADPQFIDVLLSRSYRTSSMARLIQTTEGTLSLDDAHALKAFCDNVYWYEILSNSDESSIEQYAYLEPWQRDILNSDVTYFQHELVYDRHLFGRYLNSNHETTMVTCYSDREGSSNSLEAVVLELFPSLQSRFPRGQLLAADDVLDAFAMAQFGDRISSSALHHLFLSVDFYGTLANHASLYRAVANYAKRLGYWLLDDLLKAAQELGRPRHFEQRLVVIHAQRFSQQSRAFLKWLFRPERVQFIGEELADVDSGKMPISLGQTRCYNETINYFLKGEEIPLKRKPRVLGIPILVQTEVHESELLAILVEMVDVFCVGSLKDQPLFKMNGLESAPVLGMGGGHRLMVLWRPSTWAGRNQVDLIEALVKRWLSQACEGVLIYDNTVPDFLNQDPWQSFVLVNNLIWPTVFEGNLRYSDWRWLGDISNVPGSDMQLHFSSSCFILSKDYERALTVHITLARQTKHWAIAAACHLELGQVEEAAILFEKSSNYERAQQLWQRLGELKRADHAWQSHLASGVDPLKSAAYFEEQEDYVKAVSLYAEAGSYRRAGSLCETYLDQPEWAAQLYYDAGYYKDAARLFLEVDDPKGAARAFVDGGFFKKAERIMAEIGESDFFESILWEKQHYHRLLRYYERQNNFDGAVKALHKLDSPAALAEAETHFEKRQFFKALIRFFLREDWENVGIAGLRAREFAVAGRGFEKAGQFDQAGKAYFRADMMRESLACYLQSPLDSQTVKRRVRDMMKTVDDPDYLRELGERACAAQEWHAAGLVFEALRRLGRAGCCYLAAGILKRVRICWRRIEEPQDLEDIAQFAKAHGFIKQMAEFFLSEPQLCFQYWSRGAFKLREMPHFFEGMATYFKLHRNDKGLELYLLMFQLRDKELLFFEYVASLLEERRWFQWLIDYMERSKQTMGYFPRLRAKFQNEINRGRHQGEALVWRLLMLEQYADALIVLGQMEIDDNNITLFWKCGLMSRVTAYLLAHGIRDDHLDRLLFDAPLIVARQANLQADKDLMALGYLWGGQYFDAAQVALAVENWPVFLKAKFLMGHKNEIRRRLHEGGAILTAAKALQVDKLKSIEIRKIPGLAKFMRYLNAVLRGLRN